MAIAGKEHHEVQKASGLGRESDAPGLEMQPKRVASEILQKDFDEEGTLPAVGYWLLLPRSDEIW
ncbi:MAG: hypothetical protein AUK43_08980 [Oscillatoriales cyanobacterium CG2_30_40_61]|nr:MAG: hypothetical protein AUK43_08980 [Oscillatoriales cyanobacterium CG2_30_40_61]